MRNRPYGFEIYLVNVKTIRTIAQIFVAFSEKLNFNIDQNDHKTKAYFENLLPLKFSFSEKTTKMCAIVLMVLKFT